MTTDTKHTVGKKIRQAKIFFFFYSSFSPECEGDMAATQYPSWGAMYVRRSWSPCFCTRPQLFFIQPPAYVNMRVEDIHLVNLI